MTGLPGLDRNATLHNWCEVTLVLSKKRPKQGPKNVKIIVSTLTAALAGVICL